MDKYRNINNVLVIGAGGNLCPLIIASLQSLGFTVSVLIRAASTAEAPLGTTLYRTDYSHSSLLAAFQGQDAVINPITMPSFSDQKVIINAALEAGVKRFVPGEFGIDTSKKRTVEIVPFLKAKPEIIEYLRSLEDKMSWSAIITGPFFDWGLRNGFFSFDIPSMTAYIHQPGYHSRRFSCTTLSTVANAVARSLLPENASLVSNQYIYIRSFTVSQDEVMRSLQDTTKKLHEGRRGIFSSWKIVPVNLEEKVVEAQQMLAQGNTS